MLRLSHKLYFLLALFHLTFCSSSLLFNFKDEKNNRVLPSEVELKLKINKKVENISHKRSFPIFGAKRHELTSWEIEEYLSELNDTLTFIFTYNDISMNMKLRKRNLQRDYYSQKKGRRKFNKYNNKKSFIISSPESSDSPIPITVIFNKSESLFLIKVKDEGGNVLESSNVQFEKFQIKSDKIYKDISSKYNKISLGSTQTNGSGEYEERGTFSGYAKGDKIKVRALITRYDYTPRWEVFSAIIGQRTEKTFILKQKKVGALIDERFCKEMSGNQLYYSEDCNRCYCPQGNEWNSVLKKCVEACGTYQIFDNRLEKCVDELASSVQVASKIQDVSAEENPMEKYITIEFKDSKNNRKVLEGLKSIVYNNKKRSAYGLVFTSDEELSGQELIEEVGIDQGRILEVELIENDFYIGKIIKRKMKNGSEKFLLNVHHGDLDCSNKEENSFIEELRCSDEQYTDMAQDRVSKSKLLKKLKELKRESKDAIEKNSYYNRLNNLVSNDKKAKYNNEKNPIYYTRFIFKLDAEYFNEGMDQYFYITDLKKVYRFTFSSVIENDNGDEIDFASKSFIDFQLDFQDSEDLIFSNVDEYNIKTEESKIIKSESISGSLNENESCETLVNIFEEQSYLGCNWENNYFVTMAIIDNCYESINGVQNLRLLYKIIDSMFRYITLMSDEELIDNINEQNDKLVHRTYVPNPPPLHILLSLINKISLLMKTDNSRLTECEKEKIYFIKSETYYMSSKLFKIRDSMSDKVTDLGLTLVRYDTDYSVSKNEVVVKEIIPIKEMEEQGWPINKASIEYDNDIDKGATRTIFIYEDDPDFVVNKRISKPIPTFRKDVAEKVILKSTDVPKRACESYTQYRQQNTISSQGGCPSFERYQTYQQEQDLRANYRCEDD